MGRECSLRLQISRSVRHQVTLEPNVFQKGISIYLLDGGGLSIPYPITFWSKYFPYPLNFKLSQNNCPTIYPWIFALDVQLIFHRNILYSLNYPVFQKPQIGPQ